MVLYDRRAAGSSAEAHRHAATRQIFFQRANRMFGGVKNRSGQRCVGLAFAEDGQKIVERFRAAGSDHRNRNLRRDRRRQAAIEAAAGTVAVNRGQQNFARAARDAFPRPG